MKSSVVETHGSASIKELSKEQKLKVIDLIFESWMALNHEWYICIDIRQYAISEGFISEKTCRIGYPTEIALQLIPELMKIKPKSKNMYSGAWFGYKFKTFGGIRTKKLLKLKEIIEKS
jgi:hypothetical protein